LRRALRNQMLLNYAPSLAQRAYERSEVADRRLARATAYCGLRGMDGVATRETMKAGATVAAGFRILDLAVVKRAFRERMGVGGETLMLVDGCEALLADEALFRVGYHGIYTDAGCGSHGSDKRLMVDGRWSMVDGCEVRPEILSEGLVLVDVLS
jgi:hypothetical protein